MFLVAGSDTVSFVPNHTHKSITPFWVRKKQSILRLTAFSLLLIKNLLNPTLYIQRQLTLVQIDLDLLSIFP